MQKIRSFLVERGGGEIAILRVFLRVTKYDNNSH